MLYDQRTYIGIDPTAGRKPIAYAAIDDRLNLLALEEANLEEVLAFLAGQRQALVAVCAPRRPNLGLLEREDIRQSLSPAPRPGRWTNFRVAEYLLRVHNISSPRTPSKEADCPKWVRYGFNLYRRLEELGYQAFGEGSHPHEYIEVYPHACYAALLGLLPFPKASLEGRIQRQMVLYDKRIKVTDPMHFFEEITRHRFLRGILPTGHLYQAGELDALVAAYTAWTVILHPDQVTRLGHTVEGELFLPVKQLKARYTS